MDRTLRDDGERWLDLIPRSFRHQEALWSLVLAAYRVELTGLLSRAARSGFEDGDTDDVIDLSDRIASAADAVKLDVLRTDALTLRASAAAAKVGGSEREEGRVLVLGLKVIDRILEADRGREKSAQGSGAAPN
jgi:hypothetical protein